MNINALPDLFQKIAALRVGVIGDFAVDVYYHIEKDTGEISLETGKIVHRGGAIRTYLGAAGNVVKNFRALGVQHIQAFGLRNEDLWGRELLHLLHAEEVDTAGLLIQPDQWQSCAYVKPMMGKEEDHRLDFGSYNETDPAMLDQLMHRIREALPSLDILFINQQFVKPLLNPKAVETLNQLSQEFPQCRFIADMRSLGQFARHITLKVNTAETARVLEIPPFDERHTEKCEQHAKALSKKLQAPVLFTRGAYGMLYCDKDQLFSIPGIWHDGEIDPVGAGDTAISTFAACLAAEAEAPHCLTLANTASAVTVRKLYQTGTASPQEIEQLLTEPSYVHHPYRAAHPETARFFRETDIEIVEEYSRELRVKYVMLDHDGTISVLREGWEDLMQPMMVQSIAGDALPELSSEEQSLLYQKTAQLISQTTGAPTIVQMEGLVELIHREGHVPEETIQSAEFYKERFLELLNDAVGHRIRQFEQGELGEEDFTIKGAISFLHKLKEASVQLFLASGTDEEYVKQEANTLGYGPLFDGGIHGAKPDGISAKRKVLRYLLDEKQASPEEIIVIGDGPSEIREGRKVGALCVGIASDELRRHGLSTSKRERLIRAGAHIIIGDYSQASSLLSLLLSKNI
uniref:PfkB family carbohydrate kinase n=1 Tax=Roseihalotalea indica TaxID=2867963 RepID=A0AA49GMW6_9BACT|nr:PfkB family carbohydrate kinase [Tunicatimonas sp. TK19036]